MDAVKILGSLLGGGSMSSGLGGQVLGDLLGSVMGSTSGQARQGTRSTLGGLLGGAGRSGGLGGILGGIAMTAITQYASGRMGKASGGSGAEPGLENVLGAMLGGGAQSAMAMTGPQPDLEFRAQILVRAMIGAAKSDGRIDQEEEGNIIGRLGDLDDSERAFLRRELRSPSDASLIAADTPTDMTQEVYTVSLLAIELDEHTEAQYLAALASALGLSAAQCNAIHRQLGAPEIFKS